MCGKRVNRDFSTADLPERFGWPPTYAYCGLSQYGVLRCTAMKRAFLIVALLVTCSSVLSCGGEGPLSLSVEPAFADASTNYQTGTYQSVVLTAILSNGEQPSGVQWTTSDPCVAVGNDIADTTTVVCNFTCPGPTATAVITATAQGQTGMSSVTCTWID